MSWLFSGKSKSNEVSAAGKSCAILFQSDAVGCDFLHLLLTEFKKIDGYSSNTVCKTFYSDISHIVKAAIDDIISNTKEKRSIKRIDVYFYINQRYKDYAQMAGREMVMICQSSNSKILCLSYYANHSREVLVWSQIWLRRTVGLCQE